MVPCFFNYPYGVSFSCVRYSALALGCTRQINSDAEFEIRKDLMDDRRIWVDADAYPVVIKNIKKGAFLSKSDCPLFLYPAVLIQFKRFIENI